MEAVLCQLSRLREYQTVDTISSSLKSGTVKRATCGLVSSRVHISEREREREHCEERNQIKDQSEPVNSSSQCRKRKRERKTFKLKLKEEESRAARQPKLQQRPFPNINYTTATYLVLQREHGALLCTSSIDKNEHALRLLYSGVIFSTYCK